MTVFTNQAWGALVVYGLADPESSQSGKGVVFTNGKFALPTAIPSADFTLRARLIEIGGETFTANLRDPCSAGGGISAKVDDTDGLLSRLFVRDTNPGWSLEDALLSDSATTIHLRDRGGNTPTVNQILWIEAEAVKVTVVTPGDTDRLYTCTVTRGVCGSFAVSHHLTPSVYWVPGSDGLHERILVTSRPQPTRHRFFARAYRLRDAGATTEVSHYRDGYLARLVPQINPRQWEFFFEPAGKLLEDFEVRKNVAPVRPARCIEIVEMFAMPSAGGTRILPFTANLWLTGKEASLLFDLPVRPVGSQGLDPTAISLAEDIYVSDSHHIKLTGEAGDALYQITGIEAVAPQTLLADMQTQFVRVGLHHRKSETLDLTDKTTVPFVAFGAGGGFTRYLGGFSEGAGVPVAPESEASAVELWSLPQLTISEFFSQVLCSNKGDSGETFDTFPPGFGIGLPEDFINWGATAGTPSLNTVALAELNQLYTQQWLWPLKPKTKPADLLNGICRLLRLIVTPLKVAGLALRAWARPFTSGADPIKLEQTYLQILQDVQPLRAIEFVSGINLLTFEPLSQPRLATVQSTKAAERGDVAKVWILTQDISALSDSAFASGDVFECCRCLFITLQDEPMVLSGMTDLDVSDYQTADYVTLTDDDVPTSDGRGVTAKRYILISIGLSWGDSGQPVLALPDELNNTAIQSTGKIAPTLRITELRKSIGAGPYTVTVRVESIGDTTFNGTTAHGAIWADIVAAGGHVRVIRPLHNQINSALSDRMGWLECYATLEAIRYIGPESEFDLELDADWLHDGLTVEDYFFSNNAIEEIFITLMDVNVANRLSITVEPIAEQWYDGGAGDDFLKFDGVVPIDGHRSLIGA